MVNLNQIAASAYGATQKLPTLPGLEDAAAQKTSFADLVQDGLETFVETQQKAEQLTGDAAMGKADINEVILAVQNADVALQGVVAIRDRVIQAYQDILRMAI
jgi:flagellar hook-basal body complex protein FliE